jgi:hypothetical protein
MPETNPTDEPDYYYNEARKKDKKQETPDERAKYKLEAKNEKIWNIYRYVGPSHLSIRDIAEQQNITVFRAYQIVLDYGGIERLQQASDYKEVNEEIENQENMLKLNQITVDLSKDTQTKNAAANKVLVDIPELNTKINTYFEKKNDVGGGVKKRMRKSKKGMRKSKKGMRKSLRKK